MVGPNLTGGIFIGSGTILFRNGSMLLNNTASGIGQSFVSLGGAATYELPAPSGHWVTASECYVSREACSRDSKGNLMNPTCEDDRAACQLLTTSSIPAGLACEPILPAQPCDWANQPSLVGTLIENLPALPVDVDYPSACAPGIVGSDRPEGQRSPGCAGQCPSGRACSDAATVEPRPCPKGSFCPMGTTVPQPCQAGTYSIEENLEGQDQCLECPAGMW